MCKMKDSIIEKTTKISRDLEEKLIHTTDDRDRLSHRCGKLEEQLQEALERAADCEKFRHQLAAKTELLDKLLSEQTNESVSIGESGINAANEFFKSEIQRAELEVIEAKETRREMEKSVDEMRVKKEEMEDKLSKQIEETESLLDKCSVLETRIKELVDKKTRVDPLSNRLIGPALPPWIVEEKRSASESAEKLSTMEPAQLRIKVLDLEQRLKELDQLCEYREDVILRIHDEITKKAARLEACEVEKSGLQAQVQILKRELAEARGESGSSRRGLGHGGSSSSLCSAVLLASDIEPELERLRGKRD
ncbi:unnamed protein product, partial [Protopolystoma xenopodis]